MQYIQILLFLHCRLYALHILTVLFFGGPFGYCNLPDVIQLCFIICLGKPAPLNRFNFSCQGNVCEDNYGYIYQHLKPNQQGCMSKSHQAFNFFPLSHSVHVHKHNLFYFFLTGIQIVCQRCLNKVLLVLNASLQLVGLSSKQAGIAYDAYWACLVVSDGSMCFSSELYSSPVLSILVWKSIVFSHYIASIADLRQDSALIVDDTDTTNCCE